MSTYMKKIIMLMILVMTMFSCSIIDEAVLQVAALSKGALVEVEAVVLRP